MIVSSQVYDLLVDLPQVMLHDIMKIGQFLYSTGSKYDRRLLLTFFDNFKNTTALAVFQNNGKFGSFPGHNIHDDIHKDSGVFVCLYAGHLLYF